MNKAPNLLRRAPAVGAVLFAGIAVGCGTASDSSEAPAAVRPPIFSVDAPAPAPMFQGSPEAFRDALVAIATPDAGDIPDVPEDDVRNDLVAKGPIQVTASGNAEIFRWSTGGRTAPDTVMRSINTHVCVLSRVGGQYRGAAAGVHHSSQDVYDRCRSGDNGVGWDDAGATWKIGGCQPSDNSLTAEAICAPGTNFITDPGGTVLGSTLFSPVNLGDGGWCRQRSDDPMWPGIAVSFLASVGGHFEGGGEVAKIIPASTPFAASLLHLESQTGSCDLDAGGYSMFAGVLNGIHVTRRGSTQVSVSTESGSKSKTLGTTKETLCYLTRVSGDFRGGEERVRIAPVKDSWGTEWWQLSVAAGRGKVYATAECVFYNQSTIILE